MDTSVQIPELDADSNNLCVDLAARVVMHWISNTISLVERGQMRW